MDNEKRQETDEQRFADDLKTEENEKAAPKAKGFSKIFKKWWFWVAISVLILIIIASFGEGTPSDLIELSEEDYRSSCEVYAYDDIARNPDDYEKKLAKFTGEVVQVLRDGDELQLRVNVTENSLGFYEDTIYVFYNSSGKSNILEEDIITIYGELRGMQTYESIFGQEISIPRVYAQYIDIN